MSNMQWAFPRGDGRKKGTRLEPTPFAGVADSQRIEWIDRNRSAEHDSDAIEHWVVSWVAQGRSGNENGASGRFVARAPSFRECIDKFLSGDIVRID